MQLEVELNVGSEPSVADVAGMEKTTPQAVESASSSDHNSEGLTQDIARLASEKEQYEQQILRLKSNITRLIQRKDEIEAANAQATTSALGDTARSHEKMKADVLALSKRIDDLRSEEKELAERIEEMHSALENKRSEFMSRRTALDEIEHHILGLIHTNAELAANIEAKKAALELMDEDAADESNNSVAKDAADATEDAADATEDAAETTATPAKEEDKKTMKQKMYSFMIAFLAHPVTKSATVVVFTAGLLALGATLANILTLAVAATISVVGLFAGSYTYHRAQVAKKLEAEKTAATTGEEKPAEKPANTAEESAVPVTTTVVDSTEEQANDDQEDTSEEAAAIYSPGM